MIFENRSTKYQQIDLVDEQGNEILGERYFAKITTPSEAVVTTGTPLNAENMNKLCQIQFNISDDTVLESGVLGYDSETYTIKVGDGERSWHNLKEVGYNGIKKYTEYLANGTEDNLTLPALVCAFFDDDTLSENAIATLNVYGELGLNLDESRLTGVIYERTNPKKVFNFGATAKYPNRTLAIDWSNATIPPVTIENSDAGSIYMAMIYTSDSRISHANAKVNLVFKGENTNVVGAYGFMGDGVKYDGCQATVDSQATGEGQTGGGFAYGFSGAQCVLLNCKATVTQSGMGCSAGYRGNYNVYEFCETTSTSDTGAGYGFYNDNCKYVHCNAIGKGGAVSYGYRGNSNAYDSCEARALRQGENYVVSMGFKGDKCSYLGCKSYAENKYAYGYNGVDNRYEACDGTGVGIAVGPDTGIGVGFLGHNVHMSGCKASGLTPSGYSAAGYKADIVSEDTYHVISDSIFTMTTKSGYEPVYTRMYAINMQTTTGGGVYIVRGNLIDNRLSAINASPSNDARYIYKDNVVLLQLDNNLD